MGWVVIVPRRSPWYQEREVPCSQPDDEYLLKSGETPYGDGFTVDCIRLLFHKWGYVDDIIRGEHVEFTPEEWDSLIECTWAEVVTLDWKHALRARVEDLVPQKAQLTRAGVDIVCVYLQVFRADRLRSLGDFHG